MTGHTSGISLSSDPLLWHTEAPLLCVPVPLPLVFSSQGFLPSNHLWALSFDLLCNPFTIYCPFPLGLHSQPSALFLYDVRSPPLAVSVLASGSGSGSGSGCVQGPESPENLESCWNPWKNCCQRCCRCWCPGRGSGSSVCRMGARRLLQHSPEVQLGPWREADCHCSCPRATLCSPPALGND